MTLICVKFDADLINSSKVTSHKTKWSRFSGLSCRYAPLTGHMVACMLFVNFITKPTYTHMM